MMMTTMTTTTDATTEQTARTAGASRRPIRRGHAAAGGRILAAGLSVGTALGVVGLLARNDVVAATPVETDVQPQIVVRVVMVDDPTADGGGASGDLVEAAASPGDGGPFPSAPAAGGAPTGGGLVDAAPTATAAPAVTAPTPTVLPAPAPSTTVARSRAS